MLARSTQVQVSRDGKIGSKHEALSEFSSSDLKSDSCHFPGVLRGIKHVLSDEVQKSFNMTSHSMFIQGLATKTGGESVTFT